MIGRHDLSNQPLQSDNDRGERDLALGLDVLEALASNESPLTLLELAAKLNEPVFSLARSVKIMQGRGFITKLGDRHGYALADKLLEIGLTAQPINHLLNQSPFVLRALAYQTGHSANLSVPSGARMLVVSRAFPHDPLCISVPVGFHYDMAHSSAGLVFATFGRAGRRESMSASRNANTLRVEADGFARADGPLEGVVEISCPIFESGDFIAALTLSLTASLEKQSVEVCASALLAAAAELTASQAVSPLRRAGDAL